MFERFTDRSRRVLIVATNEARGLNHAEVGTEHLCLAMLDDTHGVGSMALRGMDVDLADLARRVRELSPPGPYSIIDTTPLTDQAKGALRHASLEAQRLGHDWIGTEHLLLGLLHQRDGTAATALAEFDVELNATRDKVVGLLTQYGCLEP